MMKTLNFTAKVLLAVFVFSSMFVSCYDDSAILERLDKLEGTTIKNIEQQISAINTSITSLQGVDQETKTTLSALSEQMKKDEADNKAQFDALSAYSLSLSDKIDGLQVYVDSLSASNVDWANATFSTLAQYDSIIGALAGINVAIADLNKELSAKIENTADSLKLWVNDALTGYYDIETMDAKMMLLKSGMSSYSDSVMASEAGKIKTELDSARSQLTSGYKKAIAEAIETNNGVIDNKIAKEVSTLNDRIDKEVAAINESIAKLEGRIETLENEVKALQDEQNRKLDIVFSDNDISCLAGDDLTIGYTIKDGTPNTKVYTLGENGWKGTVKASTDSTGTISVVVPTPYTDGVILVFVNDDANKTAIRSLNFVQGSMTLSSEVVMADTEGDTLSVDIDTDLEYEISVPAECDWVHFQSVTTRSAMRHEKATFVVDENLMAGSRSAVVDVNRKGGTLLYQITIRQSGATMQANEIWYTSTDGKIVDPTDKNVFGAKIVSNIYGGRKGIITFDRNVTSFGQNAFHESKRLESISIPLGVVEIGEYALGNCESLKKVCLPDSLETISSSAFYFDSGLLAINFPRPLTCVGSAAFYRCYSLEYVELPSDLEIIGTDAFWGCYNLNVASFPAKMKTIGDRAFCECSNLTKALLPDCLTTIGKSAFSMCTRLAEVHIPQKLITISDYAFSGCQSLNQIILPEQMSNIGVGAFGSSGLEHITLSKELKSIGASAFFNSSIDSIVIPENVIEIGQWAFSQSKVTFVDLRCDIKEIEGYTFYQCANLVDIIFPKDLHTIKESAFDGCTSLKNIGIPNSIKELGTKAFANCENLKSIFWGTNYCKIGPSTFQNCSSLEAIHFSNFPLKPYKDAFTGAYPSDITLYVPFNTKKLYQENDIWSQFKEVVEVDSVHIPKIEVVDLGLSVKWTTANIGAFTPEDYGYYYAWGASSCCSDYATTSYVWYGGAVGSYAKYNSVDNKSLLDDDDDVATYYYGYSYRLPTDSEISELIANCTAEGITQNQVKGMKFTSNINGNSIFLPGSGYYFDDTFYNEGSGYYWAKNQNVSNVQAYYMMTNYNGAFCFGYPRPCGMTIRSVCAE